MSSYAREATDSESHFLFLHRYVSAPEKLSGVPKYHMHEQSHAIIPLSVHLAQQQAVYFQLGREQDALQNASIRDTHLTAWFNLNEHDEVARQYLYTEIATQHFFKNYLENGKLAREVKIK